MGYLKLTIVVKFRHTVLELRSGWKLFSSDNRTHVWYDLLLCVTVSVLRVGSIKARWPLYSSLERSADEPSPKKSIGLGWFPIPDLSVQFLHKTGDCSPFVEDSLHVVVQKPPFRIAKEGRKVIQCAFFKIIHFMYLISNAAFNFSQVCFPIRILLTKVTTPLLSERSYSNEIVSDKLFCHCM